MNLKFNNYPGMSIGIHGKGEVFFEKGTKGHIINETYVNSL